MDHSIISRSEAVFRLQEASSLLNCAVRAVRDGNWSVAVRDAEHALEKVETILEHLEEAAEHAPVLDKEEPSTGSMGYRGSAGNHRSSIDKLPASERPAARSRMYADSKSSIKPPEPIAIPTPVKVSEPEPVKKPIVTPAPSARRIDRHRPLVGENVQWERNWTLLMPAPRKLERISEDGLWGFVEGSTMGIPYEELIQELDI